MIQALNVHTVQSDKRWEGQPSIPKRAFGPVEYLSNLSRKVAKPQDAGRSLHTIRIGSFKITRSQHEEHGPKAKEQSLSAKFAAWFDTTFANSDPQWKQKAI